MKRIIVMIFLISGLFTLRAQNHFRSSKVGNAVDFMNLVIRKAQIETVPLEAGDEIAVFDGNMCCGFVVLTQAIDPAVSGTYAQIKAVGDDGKLNGFTPNKKMYFRFWDHSAGKEYHNMIPEVKDNTGKISENIFVKNGTAFIELVTSNTNKTMISTAWDFATSWDPEGQPEPYNDVIIPSDVTAPFMSNAYNAFCGSLTIENGVTLEIQSSSSGTGSLIIDNGISGTGVIRAKRYLTKDVWHLVSTPVLVQPISGFLNSNAAISTKPDGITKGMMDYNEILDDWSNFFTNSTIGNIEPGKGYCVRTSSNSSITFSGTLGSNNLNIPVTKNTYGWNLLGNPFTSAMMVRQEVFGFLAENNEMLDPSFKGIYLWDPTYNNGAGEYRPVNLIEGSAFLASGQGFFVKASKPGNIVFKQSMQVHQPGETFKSASISWPALILRAQSEKSAGSTKIMFNEMMTAGLDPGYDAGKFKSEDEINLFTKLVDDNGVDFGLQCLPESLMEKLVIPVGIQARETGEISFSIETTQMDNIIVALEDRKLGIKKILAGESDVYTTLAGNEQNNYGRFFLHLGIETAYEDLTEKPLRVWNENGKIAIEGSDIHNSHVKIYDISGRIISENIIRDYNHTTISLEVNCSGIYLIRIIKGNKVLNFKLPLTRSY